MHWVCLLDAVGATLEDRAEPGPPTEWEKESNGEPRRTVPVR